MESISDYGQLMTISDFIDNVVDGSFIDYDGYGRLCTADAASEFYVIPSYVDKDERRLVLVCSKVDIENSFEIHSDFLANNSLVYIDWYNR